MWESLKRLPALLELWGPVVLGGALCLLVLLLLLLRKLRRFRVRRVSVRAAWVRQGFDRAAKQITEAEYELLERPVQTQTGQYRAAFLKDARKTMEDAMALCCGPTGFSEEFCRYCEAQRPRPRRKDLPELVTEFLDYRREALAGSLEQFLSRTDPVTPEEFFEIKRQQMGDVVGVYIIHNVTQDMYYIGQAKRLFFRINQHFTGHGNGDVYADYKYGDEFAIRILSLADSGFQDLDLLERELIKQYDACRLGYNRTRGNS
jgi:hypothetical protein